MLSVNRPNDATWGQGLEVHPAQPTPPAAASASSASAVAAASMPALTEDEAMAAATLMDFAADAESLVAAYLSRQEAGPMRVTDIVMQTDEPIEAQPESMATATPAPVAAAKPQTADASTQTVALTGADASHPISANAPARPIAKVVQTCLDAISLIKNNPGLPPSSILTIADSVNDEGLALLAEAITSTQHPPIHLRLVRQGYTFTAAGLKQLAPLNLTGLAIADAAFFPQDYESFADTKYPIQLGLAKPKSHTQNIPGYGQNTVVERTPYLQSAISLRTLENLLITDSQVSAAEMAAIQAHPRLKILTVTVPVPHLFRFILANQKIEKLTMAGRDLDEARLRDGHALQGLSTHPALQYLSINYIDTRQLLSAIGANARIVDLKLRVSPMAAGAVRELGKMPALRDLVLRASEPNAVLQWSDIADLCNKPLQSFHLYGFRMDESAVSTAVRAQSRDLLVSAENIAFSPAQIGTLCANEAVSHLALGGNIQAADAARLAASPKLKQLTLRLVPSDTAHAVAVSAQRAWVAAGKPPSTLQLGPLDTDYKTWTYTTWMR